MTPQHVTLVIEGGYPWYFGGVSEWTCQYLKHFDSTRFSIVQIATKPWRNAPLDEAIYQLGDNIEHFFQIAPPDLSNAFREVKCWANGQVDQLPSYAVSDMVHITNTGLAGILGIQMGKRFDSQTILTEHAIYWKEIERGARALECGFKVDKYGNQKQVQQTFKKLAQYTYQHTEQIFSVSKSNQPYQKELGADAVTYIPNGVERSELTTRKINAPGKELTAGWIGRCADIKNPLRFMDVADALQKRYRHSVKFTMLLSETEERDLKRRVMKRAEDIPSLTLHWNKRAYRFIDAMDMLLLTSRSESQPLVLLEALAHKVLPFGWEIGDARSELGIFVEQGVPLQTLINKIDTLWNDPVQWESEVERRFEYVSRYHTWDRIFDEYRKHYSNL